MRELFLLVAGLLLLSGVPSLPAIPWPVLPAPARPTVEAPATAAVYVYEKDSHAIPAGVTVGLDRLNRERKVVANLVEADTTNGGGDVPAQFRAALDAARKAGLPALVVLSGSTVVRVVPAPPTEAAVMEAVP